jgi:FkbM family methyltransferase
MTVWSSPLLILLRTLGRNLGLNPYLARLWQPGGYENAFCSSLLGSVRPGDVVWDVGANEGYYSIQFAHRVGLGGKVYAFEPSPVNFRRLQEACGSLPNVVTLCVGLGDRRAMVTLEQGDDPRGATSRVLASETVLDKPFRSRFEIELWAGDELVELGTADMPNVIKIDVEGFEVEVLSGMRQVLADPRVRAVGLEVHFGLLGERGRPQAPRTLEALLDELGFDVAWADFSHILASRR